MLWRRSRVQPELFEVTEIMLQGIEEELRAEGEEVCRNMESGDARVEEEEGEDVRMEEEVLLGCKGHICFEEGKCCLVCKSKLMVEMRVVHSSDERVLFRLVH